MKIGIIGAGQIGGTLARLFTKAEHQVAIANSRGPASLTALAAETGVLPVSVENAVRDRDVVVVSIPLKEIPHLPRGLFEGVPDSLVVIDTSNYYPKQRDGRIGPIERGMTESRWVEQQLKHPVVKAFNSIYARSLATQGVPSGTPGRIALPIAGDNQVAKTVVLGLVNQIGFDGIDAGGLGDSWRQQPGTPAYCTDLDAEDLLRALALAEKKRRPEWRASASRTRKLSKPA